MATTYTENLNLALQEDTSDYVDWTALQDNWKKIDAAYGELLARIEALKPESEET